MSASEACLVVALLSVHRLHPSAGLAQKVHVDVLAVAAMLLLRLLMSAAFLGLSPANPSTPQPTGPAPGSFTVRPNRALRSRIQHSSRPINIRPTLLQESTSIGLAQTMCNVKWPWKFVAPTNGRQVC